jgi:hypothetical protein
MSGRAIISLAAICILAAPLTAQPLDGPYQPDERTLLLDHFDQDFVPDGKLMTTPEIVTAAGDFTGGRIMTGCEFVEGKFANALRFHGLAKLSYPAAGNVDLTAGQVDFWMRYGFEPDLSKVLAIHRNQFLFQLDPPGSAIFSVYSVLKSICVGVWDGRRTLVCYIAGKTEWHEGEWHHVSVRWGRKLELWLDGEKRSEKDWVGVFGPMSFETTETQMYLGSRGPSSGVEGEFALDELRILGPGGEQVPPYPLITCPTLAQPPTLDGIIGEDEWQAAGRTTGFVGLNNPLLVEDQTVVRVGRDAANLYLAFECTDPLKRPLEASFTERDAAVYQEDAVDVLLQPGPGKYPYYQLVTNCIGTRFDMKLFEQDGRRGKDINWNPDTTIATSREPGRWIAEMSIPWADLGGVPESGSRWRVNFCRDADAASRLSSWSYTGGNFHTTSNFGEMLFRGDDRAMRLTELSGWTEGRLRARLDLAGRAFDPPVTATARVVDQTATTVLETSKDLSDSKNFLVEAPPLTSGAYVLTLTAGTDDAQFYYQRLPFTVQKIYDISVAGYPYEGKLWVRANTGGIENPPAGMIARAALTGAAGEAGSCEIADFNDRGVGNGAMDITGLAPGTYRVTSQALAPDGTVLGEAEAEYTHYDKPRFWRSDAGVDNTVPAPWTPVESSGGVTSVWGREYRFGARILPEQIVNQDRELLAGPVTLQTTVGGESTDLASLTASDVECPDDRAIREAIAAVGNVQVAIRTTTEFDGLQMYEVTLTPDGEARLDSLDLRVPVKREFAHFLLPSSGRFSPASELTDEGWQAAFMPQVWTGNDDLGLAFWGESDQHWRPRDKQMLQVIPEGDTAVIRAGIVREGYSFSEPISFMFGLMATPVKFLPDGDPFLYRIGGPTVLAGLWDPAKSQMVHKEMLVYQAAGNIDPAQGTLEFWFSPAGLGGSSVRNVATVLLQKRQLLKLTWHDHANMTLTATDGETTQTISEPLKIAPDDWVHVAITWGEQTRLYANGKLLGSANGALPGMQAMLDKPEDLKLLFGCPSYYRSDTWIALDEVRVSKSVRYTGEGFDVPTAPLTADADTLLLDDLDDRFRPDGEDGATRATVISGQSGELGGVPSIGCEFMDGRFGSAMRIVVAPSRWSVAVMRDDWGADAYLVWRWMTKEQGDQHGWPLPNFVESDIDLPRMNAAFDDAGVRTCTYMGYIGIGAPTRWSRQFGYEWRREPVSSQPSEPPRGHVFLDCCGQSEGYSDYMAEATRWLVEEMGFDGCYTDGNGHAYPCRNTHHGCGYYDEEGILRPTYPVLSTREYLKRMYKIIHAANPDGYLVNHVSYNILIPTMSFTDLYYTGEHEHYEDLVKNRVRWTGKQWGIWPITLGGDAHVYEAKHWAYGLLHGVGIWPQGPISRNDTQRKTVNLWKCYDAFGYREAEFIRYFTAEESGLARADDEQVKVSLYLKRECTVTLDLQAMGLADVSARNALTGRALAVAGNQITVRVRPTSFVLVRVE